ncbi:MAG: hypothetical protein JWP97_5902 [Labilithrix sp.]|nr:hypothetical protein [Labilithrix sp.]
MKAIWKGTTLAESDDTVVVEGNHYFPAASLARDLVRESDTHTTCSWKGVASYYDVVLGDDVNKDAVWYYPTPKEGALQVKDRVAFWKGVVVEL